MAWPMFGRGAWRCTVLTSGAAADVLRRGGGAPFTVDVLRDGRRVGHITGQAALHSFDDLREKVRAHCSA